VAWVPDAGIWREAHQVAVGTQRLSAQRTAPCATPHLPAQGRSAASLTLSDGSYARLSYLHINQAQQRPAMCLKGGDVVLYIYIYI
jgi:hypothetical protein